MLLGINTDQDPERPSKLRREGVITWRNWLDGSTRGPLCRLWGIEGFPTHFVLDHHGVIRYSGHDIMPVIEKLVEEAEKSVGR